MSDWKVGDKVLFAGDVRAISRVENDPHFSGGQRIQIEGWSGEFGGTAVQAAPATPPKSSIEGRLTSVAGIEELIRERDDLKAQLAKGCQCICHQDPRHDNLQDALRANKFHADQCIELRAKVAALESQSLADRSELSELREKVKALVEKRREKEGKEAGK